MWPVIEGLVQFCNNESSHHSFLFTEAELLFAQKYRNQIVICAVVSGYLCLVWGWGRGWKVLAVVEGV